MKFAAVVFLFSYAVCSADAYGKKYGWQTKGSTCHEYVCKNKGQCISYDSGNRSSWNNYFSWRKPRLTYYCECVDGTYGKHCEFGRIINEDSCESNPCKHGSCHDLAPTDIVPEYEKPRWTHVTWIMRVLASGLMKQRALDARMAGARKAAPGWNGRQKRMVAVAADGGYQQHPVGEGSVSIQRKTMFSRGEMMRRKMEARKMKAKVQSKSRQPKTMFLPKCFQKKRPNTLVKYRCQCEFGFTGYTCDVNVDFKKIELIKKGIMKFKKIFGKGHHKKY